MVGIYGDYDNLVTRSDEETYVWEGANDTACSIFYQPGYERILIGYAWIGADELVDAADKVILGSNKEMESSVYGNGDTDGL